MVMVCWYDPFQRGCIHDMMRVLVGQQERGRGELGPNPTSTPCDPSVVGRRSPEGRFDLRWRGLTVMRESPSLVAPLASWFEHPGAFNDLFPMLGSCSGPCLQWSGLLGSGSGPARVPFPMLGSDTPFEFYIDNTMRGGVGGVNHEICKIIFKTSFRNCSNVVVQRWFHTERRACLLG